MPNSEKQILYRQLGFEACYLAACALQDRVPELHGELDLDKLYRFCKFHSITSIVAMALEMWWKEHPADEEIMNKWRQSRDKAIRKNILLNAERERILSHLESIGCWYMPLKGSLLQFDYPKFGMRQMSDNDILFDESRAKDVYDFMMESGYEAMTYQQGKDDEYVRKPLYNIEMHRTLIGDLLYPKLAAYYQNVKDRLLKDPDNRFGFHFSPEDFYIYMVVHAYKHYIHGGIGIRNMLDVYVYRQKHGRNMDWAYTERELRQLGTWEFDAECASLAEKLFSNPGEVPVWEEKELRALDIYYSSGTFGTEQQAVENRLNSVVSETGNRGIIRYILQRMFPPVAYLADMNPILKEKPWLAPFFYVRRFFSALFSRRGYVLRELRNLWKLKK